MGGLRGVGGWPWQFGPAALPSPGFTEEEADGRVLRDLALSMQLSMEQSREQAVLPMSLRLPLLTNPQARTTPRGLTR